MATQSSERTDRQIDYPAGEPMRAGKRRSRVGLWWRTRSVSWLPHIDAGAFNPVFRLEARRRLSMEKLRGQSLWWMVQTALIGFNLWLVAAVVIVVTAQDWRLYMDVLLLLFILLGASLLDKFILDFSAATASLDAIEDDVRHGHFDLICLTDVRMNAYLKAKHAVAQMRSWRLMCRDMGFRLGLALAIIGHLLFLPLLLSERIPDSSIFGLPQPATPGMAASAGPSELEDVLVLVSLLPGMFALVAVYVLEPRWRLRSLAAASIAVSTQRKRAPFSLLYALGTLIGVWIMQILMAIAAMIALSQFMPIAFISGMFAGFVLLVAAAVLLLIIHIGYRILTDTWLTRSWRRLVKWGGSP